MFDFLKFKRTPFRVAAVSEVGLVRKENQDHYYYLRSKGVFCVADGMGGGQGGAKASKMVCDAVREALHSRPPRFPYLGGHIQSHIYSAHLEIQEYAAKAGYQKMGTTCTVLITNPDDWSQGEVHYVGDSRLYRYRSGVLTQLTEDHTVAVELSKQVRGRAMSASINGVGNRYSHLLTRVIGIKDGLRFSSFSIDLKPGDKYLLCSDGIYDMCGDEGLRKSFAQGGNIKQIAKRLKEKTIAAGAQDNYTMLVIEVGPFS